MSDIEVCVPSSREAESSTTDQDLMPSDRTSHRSKWILLALRAARANHLSPVQLQKTLFVFGERSKDPNVAKSYYRFRPYHYGPFDAAVYNDAEQLANEGLIFIDESAGRNVRRFELSPIGLAEAETIAKTTKPRSLDYLAKVVDWTQRLSFAELVRSVYEAFPEMRENSVFHEPA